MHKNHKLEKYSETRSARHVLVVRTGSDPSATLSNARIGGNPTA